MITITHKLPKFLAIFAAFLFVVFSAVPVQAVSQAQINAAKAAISTLQSSCGSRHDSGSGEYKKCQDADKTLGAYCGGKTGLVYEKQANGLGGTVYYTDNNHIKECSGKVNSLKLDAQPSAPSVSAQQSFCNIAFGGVQDGSLKEKAINACVAAYNKANKSGKVASADCSKVNTSAIKNACEVGAEKGKKDKAEAEKASSPISVGKKAANIDKSIRDSKENCGQFKAKSERDRCAKAYDDRIVQRAEAAGKKIKEDGGEIKDCTKIGFGSSQKNSRTQKACEKGFKAAKVKSKEQAYSGYDCGDVKTFFDFGCEGANSAKGDASNPIVKALLFILNILSVLVTVVAMGAIVYGGFLYAAAADNSGQTKQGITVIVNAVVGLLLWLFAYALVNFLVPGGIFA